MIIIFSTHIQFFLLLCVDKSLRLVFKRSYTNIVTKKSFLWSQLSDILFFMKKIIYMFLFIEVLST
jgi:hypothetical protein